MFSRDHVLYKTHLFRGHWQPGIAIIGLVGTCFIVAFSGFPAIYLLAARGHLRHPDNYKTAGLLVADVIGAYIGVSLTFLAIK
jgi:yeast amino acid transporter